MTDAPVPRCSSGLRELRHCCFCTSEMVQVVFGIGAVYHVECPSCLASGPHAKNEATAAEAWNRYPLNIAQAAPVPDGYALVPLTPTPRMVEIGCDNNPTQWNEGTPDGFAADVANDVYVSMVRASSVPSTNSCSAATKHSGTFLGYRDEHGNEMHCAHAFCPHQAKCRKGCINPVAVTSTPRGGEA